MSKNKITNLHRYYSERVVLDETLRRARHKLHLVMSEEEDAEVWQKYKAAMCDYRKLKLKFGHENKLNNRMWRREYYKPVFDETYLTLTSQLSELYERRCGAGTAEEKAELQEKINGLVELRKEKATFVKRDAEETSFV